MTRVVVVVGVCASRPSCSSTHRFYLPFSTSYQDDITAWRGGVQRQLVNTDLAYLFRGGASQQQAQRKKTTTNSNHKQQPQTATTNSHHKQRTTTTNNNNKQQPLHSNINKQQLLHSNTKQQTTNRSTQPHTTHNPKLVSWQHGMYVGPCSTCTEVRQVYTPPTSTDSHTLLFTYVHVFASVLSTVLE